MDARAERNLEIAYQAIKGYFERQPEWEIVQKRRWGETNITIQVMIRGQKGRSITIRRNL